MRPLTLGATVAAVAVLLFLAERRWPLRRPRAALFAGLAVNLLVAGIALAVAATTVRPLVLRALGLATHDRVGLFAWLPLPAPLEAVLAFLLLDLSFYWWHRANHRLPLLWRFHNVHHFDPALDVSTALRFHFVEIALSAAFRVVQVVLLGLGAGVYWAYELCFQANTLFHHSNVRLPIALERALNRLMVTPRMHGIHHSQVEAEAMSNYGVLLPWWDRLHRTLRLNVPQQAIAIGVPGYARPEDNRPLGLLAAPFVSQRDYWRRQDGVAVERETLPGTPSELAE
ncbi:MAG TPA: sterol desaturase family protein [Thermoanaerobaculia bacterium]|nr:sterol desaturase family protein [Thermoanaerobaculia bacterium]